MGVSAGLYMCDVVKKFTFAISSPDEFLCDLPIIKCHILIEQLRCSRSFKGICSIKHLYTVAQKNKGRGESKKLSLYFCS